MFSTRFSLHLIRTQDWELRESNRTPIVPLSGCEIFCQFTRNFRNGRPSSRDLCVLTGCEVSIPEEIRESNPGHFDTSQDTWEVAGWKSDRPAGFDGVVRGPGGELPRRFACGMSDGGVSIHHWLAFSSSGWCNLGDIPTGMGTILLRSAGNIFRASKAAAGYRML